MERFSEGSGVPFPFCVNKKRAPLEYHSLRKNTSPVAPGAAILVLAPASAGHVRPGGDRETRFLSLKATSKGALVPQNVKVVEMGLSASEGVETRQSSPLLLSDPSSLNVSTYVYSVCCSLLCLTLSLLSLLSLLFFWIPSDNSDKVTTGVKVLRCNGFCVTSSSDRF